MIITDQTQFNNINSSQIKQQYSIVIWQLHHCHYRVEQQHLCWILLDTNDFNQQQKYFLQCCGETETSEMCSQSTFTVPPTQQQLCINMKKLWTFSLQMSPWPLIVSWCGQASSECAGLPATQHRTSSVVNLSHRYISEEQKFRSSRKKVTTHMKRSTLQWCIHKQKIKNTNILRITTT